MHAEKENKWIFGLEALKSFENYFYTIYFNFIYHNYK